jgi:nitrite reductase (NADH) small subunit
MTAEIHAGRVTDFTDGKRVMLSIDGREVFVFERDGRFFAFENLCPHMGGPVGEGILIGKVEAVLGDDREIVRERFSTEEIHIVCPWHGWEYDIETGRCAANPKFRIRRYEAVQRGEDVYVVG